MRFQDTVRFEAFKENQPICYYCRITFSKFSEDDETVGPRSESKMNINSDFVTKSSPGNFRVLKCAERTSITCMCCKRLIRFWFASRRF
jgi:hypothetical protein